MHRLHQEHCNDVAYASCEMRPGVNEKVTLDIKPATGANLQLSFTVPPSIITVRWYCCKVQW